MIDELLQGSLIFADADPEISDHGEVPRRSVRGQVR